MNNNIVPTRFQQAVLRFRTTANIMNAGGRGSGKSHSMMLDCLDHCRDFGAIARPLVLRESWAGLQELQDRVLALAIVAFGPSVSRNKADGTTQLPNGAVITFANVGDDTSYAKQQGKSYTALYADEVGNYPPQAFKFMMLVRSNLRVPLGRRAHIHMTANPHGRAHTQVLKGWINRAPFWQPYREGGDGEWWINATSTLEDNPHIDRASYARQLTAATGSDHALAKAWINGDWSVLGGVMFDGFNPAVHIIRPPNSDDVKYIVGGDWGSAAPATAILLARLKQDIGPLRFGSIIALDETDTADPADLALGNGAPPQMFAEQILEMAKRHGWRRPEVVMDDAKGLQSETVISLFRQAGLYAAKPRKKDRVGQWNLIRQLLANAVTGDGPGLYVTAQCPHLLETLPEAPRGTLRAEDIDPKWNRDHWCDALAYGVTELYRDPRISQGAAVIGFY
jgi:hypothetical protein